MNKHLAQLIDLSKIDKEIDSFEPRIERVNRAFNEILAQKNDILAQVANLEDEIKDLKNKKSKNEIHLAELSAKLEDVAKKTKAIKTEKEQKALSLEEEITKEQITFANEEIERFDKFIDNAKDKIDAFNLELKDIETNLGEKQDSAKEALDELEKERQSVYAQKTKLMGEMDQKIIGFYQKIRRWAGNTTVANVKKQACYGCFMKISDRIYADIIKAEDITTCPHCGRILYLEKEEEAV